MASLSECDWEGRGRQLPNQAEEMDDEALTRTVKNHLEPEFWQRRKIWHSPPKAYVRRWSRVVRREIRRRGLKWTPPKRAL